MLKYNNKVLTRFKEKSAGKNQSSIDGFYEDSDGRKFFIKKPADEKELFAELFAGLLLKELIARELIDKKYFPSLICAEAIQLEDGSYGLIQPMISFEELHKVIGTSYSDGSDRNPRIEALSGPSYYPALTQQGPHFGLSMALMFSLLWSAHSVHSGNIVVLDDPNPNAIKQYARIDWGDAFRNFAHPKNNDDILYAYENSGWLNPKRITKGYFLNYKNITGLYPAMAEKAQNLRARLEEDTFFEIITSVLEKIPADLIEQSTKNEFAEYICMDSFKKVNFGPNNDNKDFASEMAEVLKGRLNKIADLRDITPQNAMNNLYASHVVVMPLSLTVEDSLSFPQIVEQWKSAIPNDVANISIKTNLLDLSKLILSFNEYINTLAKQAEDSNTWEHDFSAHPYNVFVPYHKENEVEQIEKGHAFVPHYKESTILRHIVSLDPKTLRGAPRFDSYDKACENYVKEKTHANSAWVKMKTLATAGQGIINTLYLMKEAQSIGMDEFVAEKLNDLISEITIFQQAELDVQPLLNSQPLIDNPEKEEGSAFFYPISNNDLKKMSGDQLATICLEELNLPNPSSLVTRIIKNDELWQRVDTSFLNSDVFINRLDSPLAKIEKIREWRQVLQISGATNAIQCIQELERNVALEKSVAHSLTEELNRTKLELANTTHQIKTLHSTVNKQKETNQTLTEEIKTKEHERSIAQTSVESLTEEINDLKTQIEQRQSSTTEQVDSLTQQIKTMQHKIEVLDSTVEQHLKTNQSLSDEITIKEHEKALADASIKSLTEELSSVKLQAEQQLKDKEQLFSEEKEKLQQDVKKQQEELDDLQKLIKESREAQQKYEEATQNKKDTFYARMERMAPILLQVKRIEKKAENLLKRKEIIAYDETIKLANHIRHEVKKYAESSEPDEDIALHSFKEKAKKHVENSEEILGKHRQEWKYILGNISLAILLVGVGYVAAGLINKHTTGSFTFFNKTDAKKQTEGLAQVAATVSVK